MGAAGSPWSWSAELDPGELPLAGSRPPCGPCARHALSSPVSSAARRLGSPVRWAFVCIR